MTCWIIVSMLLMTTSNCFGITSKEFLDIKLNWEEAKRKCASMGSSGKLWSPSSVEDLQDIEKQFSQKGWTTVWTTIKRTTLKHYTWENGETEDFPYINNIRPGQCFTIKYNKQNTTLDCWTPRVGALCQKNNCRDCEGKRPCQLHENSCLWWSDDVKMPWHMSDQWCRKNGWHLAITRNTAMFRALMPRDLSLHYYWIGLRAIAWNFIDSTKSGVIPRELYAWDDGEPKKEFNCVVKKRIGDHWFLFTEDCSKSHHFVCEVKYSTKTLQPMSEKSSEATTAKTFVTIETTRNQVVPKTKDETSASGGGGMNAAIIGALCGLLVIVGVLVTVYFLRKKCSKGTEDPESLKRQGSVAYHCAPDDPSSSRANTLTRAMCPLPTVPDDHPPEMMAPNPRYSRAPICSQVVTRKLQNIKIMPEDDYESIGERLQDHFYSDLLITEDKVMDLIMKAVKTQLTKACNMSSDMRRSLIHTTTKAFVEEYLDPIEQDIPRKALLAIEGPKTEEEVAPETNLDAVAVSKETPGSEQSKEETGDQNEKETNEDTAPKDDAQTVEEVKRVLANLLKERVNKQEAEKKSA